MTLGRSEGKGAVAVGARASVGVLIDVDCSTMMVVGSQDSELVIVAVAGMLVMAGAVLVGEIETVGELSMTFEGTTVVLMETVVGVVSGSSVVE